jgi:hypothetical protein
MTHLGNGSGTNNRAIHNLCHDVSDASGTDGDGYGGHGLYFDNNTGNWLAENNLVYRVSATGYNMTAGPLVANQPNTYHNNIAAYARQSVVGVSACASAATIQQLVFADNLVYEDRGASAIQKGGGRYFYNNPTSIQDWNHNQYFSKAVNYSTDAMMFATENNPPDQNGTCMGQTQRTFAAWQGLGEDTGSKIGDPGFTAPSPCANGMPQPGVCDDYSLQNFAGVGFAPFPLTGWGRTSGPSLPQVPDTFVTAAFDPTKDF